MNTTLSSSPIERGLIGSIERLNWVAPGHNPTPHGTVTANTPMGRPSDIGTFEPFGPVATVGGPGGGTGNTAGMSNAEPARYQRWASLYGLDFGDVSNMVRGDDGRERRAGEFLDDLFEWDGAKVEAWQRRLYSAGLLGKDPSAVTWGVADEATVVSTARILNRAARYNATGVDKGLSEVLAEAERQGAESRQAAVKTSGYGEAEGQLRNAMTALLGRKPNAREVRRFKRRLNEAERSTADDDMEGLPFGLSPNDVDDDDDDFREGDAGLLAENEILAENGQEFVEQQSNRYTNVFERLMVGS